MFLLTKKPKKDKVKYADELNQGMEFLFFQPQRY